MSIAVCTKCRGPVTVECGKNVCAFCGEVYGDAEVAITEDFSTFFKNTSLEELQDISSRLADMVVFCRMGWGKEGDDRATYTIIPISNGQFYTRFIPGEGYDSAYRGQCAVENWYSVRGIYASQEYAVAIAEDGTLQPTLIEVEQLIQQIKSSGVSEMRMKQVVDISYWRADTIFGKIGAIEGSFVGLDVDGRVFIYNPFKAFIGLNAEKDEDREKCAVLMKRIKAWPTIDKLYYIGGILIGLTKDGKVYAASATSYPDEEKLADMLSGWDNIHSVIYNYGGIYDNCFIGLKKDGTLFSESNENYLNRYLSKSLSEYRDVVQIAFLESGGRRTKLAYLTRQGEFFLGEDKIDDNVISIVKGGYVRADGSVYELVCKRDNAYEAIKGVKIFSSVETMYKEFAEISRGILSKKYELNEKKQVISEELQGRQGELDRLNEEYSQLGIFKVKEKKALRLSIDNLSDEASGLEDELADIEDEILTLPSGRAAWKHFDLPQYGNYSVSQISAAAYNAVSYKKRDRSVIGGAAAGAIMAGPAGAVVGAVYAANKNRKH